MKTLLLMRHAKSSWKQKDLPDMERLLNKRGEKDAPKMGRQLKKKDMCPDMILCSPAVRARLTAEAVAKECHFKKEIQYVDQLYMAEAAQILEVVTHLPDDLKTVLLIGHNPGMEYTVQLLARKIVALPTASIAYLHIPIDHWADLKEDTECKLVKTWGPKD